MKHATGIPYLFCRNGRYTVRVQVPKELHSQLKRTEFKRSLGADFQVAKRQCHGVISHFQAQIDEARKCAIELPTFSTLAPMPTDKLLVEAAVQAHYDRMVGQMSKSGSLNIQSKIDHLTEVVDAHLTINAYQEWSALSNDATWLCAEHGWTYDEASSEFKFLCEAMLRARVQAYRIEIRRLKGIRAPDPDVDPLFTPEYRRLRRSNTLGDLIDQYRLEKELNWSVSTKSNYRIIFRVLEEICGRETLAENIDRPFCLTVRDTLLRLPSNYQKKPQTKGRSIVEAIAIGEQLGLPKMLPATINSHLSKLAAIVKVGRNAGYIAGNPMGDLLVVDNVRPKDKRDPFSIAQLNQLFKIAPWKHGPVGGKEHPAKYWGPLVALYSSARLSEVYGKLVDEVIERDGTLLFDFRHRPATRPMKWKRSRVVPVHNKLVELGFLDFVIEARLSGRELLFPDVKRDSRGKWGDAISDWFTGEIKQLKMKGTKLTFHSLRHTFEDALREADLHNTAIGNEIVGRTSVGISDDYGSSYSTAKLAEAVQRVGYSGLDLSHLVPKKSPATRLNLEQRGG